MDPDERDLVRRCRARDQAACTALVEAYGRMVGTVIWRATGDSTAVEDLAQDVFLRVFRALPYFDARAKLSTWIYTIAHRVAIDHLRQRGRWREHPFPAHNDASDSDRLRFATTVPAVGLMDPEAIAMREQMECLVRDGLAQLPDRYRLPLVYTAIDGLDYAAVAEMLGVPLGTVKTLVFRGKHMLKEWIAAALKAPAGRKVSDAV